MRLVKALQQSDVHPSAILNDVDEITLISNNIMEKQPYFREQKKLRISDLETEKKKISNQNFGVLKTIKDNTQADNFKYLVSWIKSTGMIQLQKQPC